MSCFPHRHQYYLCNYANALAILTFFLYNKTLSKWFSYALCAIKLITKQSKAKEKKNSAEEESQFQSKPFLGNVVVERSIVWSTRSVWLEHFLYWANANARTLARDQRQSLVSFSCHDLRFSRFVLSSCGHVSWLFECLMGQTYTQPSIAHETYVPRQKSLQIREMAKWFRLCMGIYIASISFHTHEFLTF